MPILSYPKHKIKVVLLEDIHPKAVEVFQNDGYENVVHLPSAFRGDALLEQIHDAYVIGIRSNTHITDDVLKKCSKMLAIGCFCIGTNQVELQAALKRGIPVFHDPHSNSRSVAELVICLSIALLRDLVRKNSKMHAGEWNKTIQGAHEVRGKILGIIGYGKIGSQVSSLAESLGMHVVYYDIEPKLSIGNARSLETLDEVLAIADVVTLHVPETALTKKMIDKKRLAKMKKSAFLINTSRGKVVDPEAILEALKNKTIQGAALDVFHEEPPSASAPFQNPFQNLDNVILTPHIGGLTEEAQENIAHCVSFKLLNFINRAAAEGSANFPSLSLPPNSDSHRILHIHENSPGVLVEINKIFAEKKINILAQYLRTTPEVGYVVFDIQKGYKEPIMDLLKSIKGTIRARILY